MAGEEQHSDQVVHSSTSSSRAESTELRQKEGKRKRRKMFSYVPLEKISVNRMFCHKSLFEFYIELTFATPSLLAFRQRRFKYLKKKKKKMMNALTVRPGRPPLLI